MPEILILSKNADTVATITGAAEHYGLRVKDSVDPRLAAEWISLREFALLIVDDRYPPEVVQDLSEILWKKDPAVPLLIFDPEGRLGDRGSEFKLIGAEVVVGIDAQRVLQEKIGSTIRQQGEKAGSFQVLIVEDLDSPRDIICSYVENLGFGQVTGVGSGREALQLLESDPGRFSCVITDVRMPEMTGRELIEQIRKHGKLQHLPVVVLTAYGTVDCLIDCLKAGASGFLVKPPKKRDLVREIGRAVRIRGFGTSPRLTSKEEAELLRDILLDKGFT